MNIENLGCRVEFSLTEAEFLCDVVEVGLRELKRIFSKGDLLSHLAVGEAFVNLVKEGLGE